MIFIALFPFKVTFDSSMTIVQVGIKLKTLLSGLTGHKLTEVFTPQRPLSMMPLSYEMVSNLREIHIGKSGFFVI